MNKDLLMWTMVISIGLQGLVKIIGGLIHAEKSNKMNAVDSFGGFMWLTLSIIILVTGD